MAKSDLNLSANSAKLFLSESLILYFIISLILKKYQVVNLFMDIPFFDGSLLLEELRVSPERSQWRAGLFAIYSGITVCMTGSTKPISSSSWAMSSPDVGILSTNALNSPVPIGQRRVLDVFCLLE